MKSSELQKYTLSKGLKFVLQPMKLNYVQHFLQMKNYKIFALLAIFIIETLTL